MDKTKIKYLVGIYAAAMCIVGHVGAHPHRGLCRGGVSPTKNIAARQMTPRHHPLMMALSAISSLHSLSRVKRRRRLSVTLS